MSANKFRFLLCSLILTSVTTVNAQGTITQGTITQGTITQATITQATITQATITQATITEQTEEVDRTQVVIMVANVSCYGRFHDSLNEHLHRKHDWIHSVSIRNTEKVRNPYKGDAGASKMVSFSGSGDLPFDIGTIAELTFSIDASKSTLDLLKAIRDSKQYSLKRWTVQVEVPIEEMLSR